MIKIILKELSDLIYGTARVKRNFEKANPTEKVLAADASKGIVTKRQEIQRGMDWVGAQRAVILLTEQKIVCGKWTIPLDTIVSAQLVRVSSLSGGGQVLKVQTKEEQNYQFGMAFNAEWTDQQALPLTVEKGKVKHSTYSIVVRIITLGLFGYFIYDRLIKK